MRKTKVMIIVMVMMSGLMLTASAEDRSPKPDRVEIRHSMLGYRDTVVFYTFKEQRAVMVLNIGNSDETFPITASVYLFDKTTTEKGLKKWINNQHSDALFGDAPEPLATRKLPAGFCTVTSREQTGTSENPAPGRERSRTSRWCSRSRSRSSARMSSFPRSSIRPKFTFGVKMNKYVLITS